MMMNPKDFGVREMLRWLPISKKTSTGGSCKKRPRLESLESRSLLTTTVTDFALPSNSAIPSDITLGPDGNLWFTDHGSGKVGEINPQTDAVSEFSIPTTGGATANPNAITVGPDGNLWFVDYGTNSIGTINISSHAISEYPIPTANSTPDGIVSGPDGNIWFTEQVSGKVGKINPTTHAITEYTVPASGGVSATPSGIVVGSDGNLWFTELIPTKLGSINPTTDAFSSISLPSGVQSSSIIKGPDGNLWFTSASSNQIANFNIATSKFATFNLPSAGSQPQAITFGSGWRDLVRPARIQPGRCHQSGNRYRARICRLNDQRRAGRYRVRPQSYTLVRRILRRQDWCCDTLAEHRCDQSTAGDSHGRGWVWARSLHHL